jgi:DNA transformation protein
MRVSSSFHDFVLDQLAAVPGLRSRAMFGGVGLYAGDVFFGLLAADTLYLKVDDTNRAQYERTGSKPFKPYADRPMVMPYYNVPVNVLENASTLTDWARQSVVVATATATSKRKPAARAGRARSRS